MKATDSISRASAARGVLIMRLFSPVDGVIVLPSYYRTTNGPADDWRLAAILGTFFGGSHGSFPAIAARPAEIHRPVRRLQAGGEELRRAVRLVSGRDLDPAARPRHRERRRHHAGRAHPDSRREG